MHDKIAFLSDKFFVLKQEPLLPGTCQSMLSGTPNGLL